MGGKSSSDQPKGQIVKNLMQYLEENITRGVIDHAVRAARDADGNAYFYIHPANADGDTLDFKVQGNQLAQLNPVPEGGQRKAHLTPEDIESVIVKETSENIPGTMVTLVTLHLRNGAKVIGINYGAIDPARHDWSIGYKEARKNAFDKVWELEGYLLRERLAGGA